MPKKQNRANRKGSLTDSKNKTQYQQKPSSQWQCQVCKQKHTDSQQYCTSCVESLYYYCYVNNQMFVTRDDSYLEIYYHQHSDQSFEGSQAKRVEQEDRQELNLNWVQNLLD